MIPLYDENPSRTTPLINWAIIGAATAVFLYEFNLQLQSEQAFLNFIDTYALVPRNLLNNPSPQNILTLFTAMFLHADWLHIIFNMLYLWIFGNNIEDSMGHIRYFIFYLLAGLGGSGLQMAVDPNSTLPNLGASGAISGVLGAYLILYPNARVISLVFFGYFIRLVRVPALIVLGLWIVLQLISGIVSLDALGQGGVAYFAHIGGFITGLLLVKLFARRRRYAC
ncbi:MAG: rhomboid family intramembrane serine protease [Chloroflexi bacterium]|nr:rhomboid family intramembrane serine protease [Chloroflexota bacterium]